MALAYMRHLYSCGWSALVSDGGDGSCCVGCSMLHSLLVPCQSRAPIFVFLVIQGVCIIAGLATRQRSGLAGDVLLQVGEDNSCSGYLSVHVWGPMLRADSCPLLSCSRFLLSSCMTGGWPGPKKKSHIALEEHIVAFQLHACKVHDLPS